MGFQKEASRKERKIALILCPCFTVGTPPLGLAYLQAVLKEHGYTTLPLDLDFLLLRYNPDLFFKFYAAYNIGHQEDIDMVQFILRPYFTLVALFPGYFPDETRRKYNSDLKVIEGLRRFLRHYAEYLVSQNVQIAMFSVYISNLLPSLLFARELKDKIGRSLKVVFGGPGVGLREVQDLLLRLGWVDVCTVGEGEKNVHDIAEALFSRGSVAGIPGVSILEGCKVKHWPSASSLNLNELPTPDFTDFPCPGHSILHYRSNPKLNTRWNAVAIPISTTRGCVRKCAFCSESQYWKRFRQRKVELVIEEIEAHIKKWGMRQFQFCDSLLNGRKEWIEEFTEKVIEKNLNVEFVWAYFRPIQLPLNILRKMHKAGFKLVYYGMESGSQRVLDMMRKGTRVEEIKRIVKDTLRCGIHVDITMLCGFPGESRTDFYESLFFYHRLTSEIARELGESYLAKLSIDAGSIIRVEPYSDLFKNASNYGIRFRNEEAFIPPELEHLRESVKRLLLYWESDLSVEEKILRAMILRSFAHKEPSIIYEKSRELLKITDDTVFSKVEEDVNVLTSLSSGTHYIIRGDTVLAEINDPTYLVWQLINGERSVGEIKRKALEAYRIRDIDSKIERVIEQFLRMRLIFFNDFTTQLANEKGTASEKGAGAKLQGNSG
jgi:radical SAM superfamily enzyme YgiQ (UPF0313 family)